MEYPVQRIMFRVVVLVLSLLAVSCGPPAARFDRRQMLRELTENVILPTYRDLADRTAELEAATSAHCAAPSTESLDAARDAWRATREPLQASWLFHFGPARDQSIQGDLDFWPVRPDSIEASLVAAPATIDPAWVATLGVSSKGFPAIEYLLFADDVTVTDARRCAYASAITSELTRRTADLRDAWEPERGGYATTLTEESTEYPTLHDAVSAFYNGVFSATESIKVRKIGNPQGRENALVPQPDQVESRFAAASSIEDTSVEDMLHAMRAVRSVITGTRGDRDGLGIEDAIAELRPDAVPDVLARIDAAIDALENRMPRPFHEHLADPEVEAVYQALVAVVRVMSTDVAALLAVTVTFTDNDGD